MKQVKLFPDKGAVPTAETGWARLFQVIGNNYQNWIFMLLCIIATLFALFIGEIFTDNFTFKVLSGFLNGQ